MPLVGAIASVEADGSLIIDLLKSDGLKKGMKLTVERKGKTMMIKGKEVVQWDPVGEIEVIDAGDEYSTAKVKSGSGLQVGDQVKVKVGK